MQLTIQPSIHLQPVISVLNVADREYDANRHCGVTISETGRPCTRSLTCKVSSLEFVKVMVTVRAAVAKWLANMVSFYVELAQVVPIQVGYQVRVLKSEND